MTKGIEDYLTGRDVDEIVSAEGREEMDFQKFLKLWKRKLRSSRSTLNEAIVWREIKSFIKGSIVSLHIGENEERSAQDRYLSLDEYLALGRKESRLDKTQRREAYEIFLKYEKLKKENGFYDEGDLVHNIASRENLGWIEDPTNSDTDIARNRIRLEVMPVLRSLRQGADSAMARSIVHLQTARDLLELVTEQALEESRMPEGRLNLDVLFAQDEALAARIIRGWLKQHGAPTPPTKRLAEFLRQLRVAREPFAQMDLADPASGQAWQVIRERGFLRIGR